MERSCSNQRLYWTNASDPIVGIHCHGLAACYNSTIKSDIGEWTPQCDASVGCLNLRQDLDETMIGFYCGGYFGCHNAFSKVFVNTIYCGAMKSCSGISTVSYSNLFSNYIQCKGFASCAQNEILTGGTGSPAANIFGYGMLSLWQSNISSFGVGRELNVYFYGLLSGHRTNISCFGNDTCNVHCYTPFSCLETILTCVSENATCARIDYYNRSNISLIENVYKSEIWDEFSWLLNELTKDNNTDAIDISEDYEEYYSQLCDWNECSDKYDCQSINVTLEAPVAGNISTNEERYYYCVTGYSAGNLASIATENDIDIVVDGAYRFVLFFAFV